MKQPIKPDNDTCINLVDLVAVEPSNDTRMNWADLVELAEDQRRLIELLQRQLTHALETVARLHEERNSSAPTIVNNQAAS